MRAFSSSLRLSAPAILLVSMFTLPTLALDFSVDLVNCTQLDWTATLSQTEWSVASYVELFFVSPQGARNYSLLYSALNGGAFPTPGTYNKVTYFGDTALSGMYRIGIGLADMNGNILTTTTSSSQGSVQVTSIDPRSFTFGDCTGSSSAGGVAAATRTTSTSTSLATASTSATISSAASTALTSATSAPTVSTQPIAASSTVSAPATSTSAAAAAAGSLSSASISSLPTSHSVNKGAIAGGVIGGLVLLLFAFALVRWCSSRRRTRRLSLAAHRMSAMRSPSLSEKQAGSPAYGTASPDGTGHKTANVFASSETYEVAELGRLSVGSRRRSEGYARRSMSHGDNLSLANALAEGPFAEQEVTVVRVPFHLTPGEQVAPPHDSMAIDASTFSSSATPYLELSRTSSNPMRSLSTDNFVPTYPGDASHSRSKSTPLVLDLPSTVATPQISPTGSTFQNRTLRTSHSNSNFKIPRVSVPAYLAGSDAQQADAALGEQISRQMSRSSSMRRMSTGGATFVSLDEDPFVDAAQEPLPSGRDEYAVL